MRDWRAGRAGDVLRLIDEGMERYGTEGWDGWCDQTIFLMMAVDQHHHRAPGTTTLHTPTSF